MAPAYVSTTTGSEVIAAHGVRVYIYTTANSGTVTTFCSCSHRPDAPPRGMACVARQHKTPEDEAWEDVLRALERREEFRAFIGRPAPAPRARACRPRVLPPAADLAWRARALGRARA